MPHRRKVKKGSFGAPFEEVVKHFSHAPPPNGQRPSADQVRALQEKCDIHALLFERAKLDREHEDKGAR